VFNAWLTTTGSSSVKVAILDEGVDLLHPDLLANLNPDDIDALNQAAAKVQEMIKTAEIPGYVQQTIGDGYAHLCEDCNVDDLPVAVRSSATAEDLPTASFAGQQDTYLWMKGTDRVIESVRKCWASLYTPRAISYRVKNDFPHEKVLISVGVQKMVNSRAAGVMFTLNPTNGDISKVVIEGSWGLGETVVSGSVNPDKFVVDKVMGEINERTISTKHIECVFDVEKGETVDADVAEDMQCTCCLEDQEIKELVKTAKIIEAHYGRAWISSGPSTKILDSRKIFLLFRHARKLSGASARKNRSLAKRPAINCLWNRP
jgi:pyruvate,water dikinase